MASETSICNSALKKIAATRITSRTQGTKNANACNDIFDDKRDELLRAHAWNFAIKRQKLAKNATAPVSGFDNAFDLPSDWIRVLNVYDNDADTGRLGYRMETTDAGNNAIVTDATDVYLRYVYRVTNPNKMPPDFRETLAWLLAVDLAIDIRNSQSRSTECQKEYEKKKAEAESTDALEDFPEEQPDGSWVSERN